MGAAVDIASESASSAVYLTDYVLEVLPCGLLRFRRRSDRLEKLYEGR